MTNCGTEVHYAPANTPQYKAIGGGGSIP